MSEEGTSPVASEPKKLTPGKVRFDCEEAIETTFEEYGSRALFPGAPDITWKTPTVRLRRDIGRITSRKDIQHRPGLRMGLSLVRQMQSIGDLLTDDFKGDTDAVGALAKQGGSNGDVDISVADFMYLLIWRAWERFGDAWQYPHPFNCMGCDELISGAEIDLSQLTVYRPTSTDGTVTYRLRHPWKRIADEVVVEVVLGRPKFSYALVNCSKTEWDEEDDWAIRVREVASAIISMKIQDGDGEREVTPKMIAHQSLDKMREIDLMALSKFVGDLRLAGGTGRMMKYTHEGECGGVSNLELNWKTDFLESSGA